jgi:predicted CoA-binding protein
MTTRSSVERFLALRHLALAGASRRGKGFGNSVLATLQGQGYEVSLVHPEVTEIGGVPCVASVQDLPDGVSGLVVIVPPDQTEGLVRDAVARGLEHVWLQQGCGTPAAVQLCREAGVNVVDGECILMFARPTGIHRFHRWLRGLLGKLPRDE